MRRWRPILRFRLRTQTQGTENLEFVINDFDKVVRYDTNEMRGAPLDAGDTEGGGLEAPGLGGGDVDTSTLRQRGDSAAMTDASILLPSSARSLPSWCAPDRSDE